MTPKNKTIVVWVVSFLGGGVMLTILGMATALWIGLEVKAQLKEIIIPDTTQLTTDVAVIKATVLANSDKADMALANQQRFEEIFTEYLINEAR